MESASGESRKGRLESQLPGGAGDASPAEANQLAPSSIPQPAIMAGRLFDRSCDTCVPGATTTDSFRIVAGNPGDHKPIHALLRAANQQPSYEDFLTWLDEPTYEPSDRLLIKAGGQPISHVQILDRNAWFGGVRLPIGTIQDLATLPEYREAGYEQLLLAGAEQSLRGRQAILAVARTDRPEVFRAAGWFDARTQGYTEANLNEILALVSSPQSPWARRGRSLRTRLWRQVELEALQNVGRHSCDAAWGALDRAEPYWRWLVNRKAHDELLVAVHGKDVWAELDSPAHIVGYAVMQGSCIVELNMLPGFAKAAPRLLARACQDAIEQSHRSLSLHLAADHPLHELMLAAGGAWSNGIRGSALMLKLLDPIRWIENMYPVLLARSKAAGLSRPLQLSFEIGRRGYQLDLTRRSGHLARDPGPNFDVRCSAEAFAALLVSNLDVPAARAAGQLQIPCDAAAACVAALFPHVPFWQSQFDALRF